MVARLKLARQSTHWVEVAWQIKANKTEFHTRPYFVLNLAFQFMGSCEQIAKTHALDFCLLLRSALPLLLPVDERASYLGNRIGGTFAVCR